MRFQRLATMPASTVQDWLDHELEVRGIDAVVYTRYILSILQQDGYEVEPTEADPFPMIVGKKESSSGKLKGKGKQRLARTPKIQDRDKLKKSAAVECLLSVSEQKCGIEELVDELYSRLKSIQCEGILAQKQLEMQGLVGSGDKLATEDLVNSSPREQAEKYYAAFPALGGSSETGSEKEKSEEPCNATSQSAWKGKKLVISATVERTPDHSEETCTETTIGIGQQAPRVDVKSEESKEEGQCKDPGVVTSRPLGATQPKRSLEGKLPLFIVPKMKVLKTPSYWKWKIAEEQPSWIGEGWRPLEDRSCNQEIGYGDRWAVVDDLRSNDVDWELNCEDYQEIHHEAPAAPHSIWDDSPEKKEDLRYNDLVASIWQADEKRGQCGYPDPAAVSSPVLRDNRDEGILSHSDCAIMDTNLSSDRIWECDGLDKFIKGGVYGFPKRDEGEDTTTTSTSTTKEDDPPPMMEECIPWGPSAVTSTTHVGFERCVKVWDGLDSVDLDWPPRDHPRPLWDEYGLIWENQGSSVLGWGREETSEQPWCGIANGHSLDEPSLVKTCTLPFHNDDSRFVEVVPKRVTQVPAPSTSSSSLSLSLSLSPSAGPDYEAASSDGEENLLISPRTHFRPIRHNSRDVESSSGDELATVGAGEVALPQPMVDLFTETEDGSVLYLRQRRSASPHRYMVYKGQTSPPQFQPKFKLRSNLEKFCQTDEWEIAATGVEAEVETCPGTDCKDGIQEEIAKEEEEDLFEVIRHVRDMDLRMDEADDERHGSVVTEGDVRNSWKFTGFDFVAYDEKNDVDRKLESPEVDRLQNEDVPLTVGQSCEDLHPFVSNGDSVALADGSPETSAPFALFDFQVKGADDALVSSTTRLPTIPSNKIIYSWDLEEEWKNTSEPFDVQVPKRQSSKQKVPPQRRPCSFFMEGNCRRTDCKFSHDLASITCRFWEEGSCFKGMTCPFLHGYPRFPSPCAEDSCSSDVHLECEDEFPSLTKHVPKKTREPDNSVSVFTAKRKKRVCTPIPRKSSPFEDKASRFFFSKASSLH